jgi:hypothetical protein
MVKSRLPVVLQVDSVQKFFKGSDPSFLLDLVSAVAIVFLTESRFGSAMPSGARFPP